MCIVLPQYGLVTIGISIAIVFFLSAPPSLSETITFQLHLFLVFVQVSVGNAGTAITQALSV